MTRISRSIIARRAFHHADREHTTVTLCSNGIKLYELNFILYFNTCS